MAEIMVSASTGAMKSLLGKLATLMGEEFTKLKNLRKEVKFISDELTSMKDALEGLSYLDELDPQTKRWRDIVREISYDIEDIVDDFMQNIEESNKTTGFLSSTIQSVKTLRSRHNIAGQIKEIKALVLETSARRQRYKLDTSTYKLDTPLSSNVAIDPRIATLYETAANLVGVVAPTNELLNLLDDEDTRLKMLSIVGFGGLGKTTLANVVYGNLKAKFKQCAFVPVSQKPNIAKLLHSLLSQLGSTSSHDSELNVLLNQLREHLQNNRYLIVIDDIWDVQAWGVIKCAFPENNLGSRVIVTTRIQDVAKACCSHQYDHMFNMKPLSNEDSRRLFLDRIFGSEVACPQQLRDVSVEILRKCGGLPLAIISISSMLASTGSNDKKRWGQVRDSLRSGTNLTLDGVRQILNLSYKDLPCQLKTCLLYLGMYPEDYTIERSELERQWIAEGFVSKENGQDMEMNAKNYFNELVNRSLLQPVKFDKEGSVTECKVHDMMLDLILLKSSEENFLTIVDKEQDITGLDYKVRRLSLRLNHAAVFPSNIRMSQVRSLMIFAGYYNAPALSEFKFLRVLFVDSSTKMVLTGLDKLCHLRYFSNQSIYSYIPSGAVHMPHLLHLSIVSRRQLPDGIGNMKSLQSLSAFGIKINSLDNINGLGELTSIRALTLSGDQYYRHDHPGDMMRRMDILGSSLRKLCRLESLYLYPSVNMDGLFASSPLPCSLQRLHTCKGDWSGWFSRVPNLIKELNNLRELQLSVMDLHKDDVGILADLPSLVILELKIINPLEQLSVLCGAFSVLKYFGLGLSRASYLAFQAGTMPMVQMLKLTFSIRNDYEPEMAQEGGPAGIEHLPALEKVSAHIWCDSETESEKRSAESALRSAISIHPGSPRVEVIFSGKSFMGI